MKKTNYKSLFLLAGVLLFSSCESFLDREEWGASAGDQWKTQTDIQNAINSFHSFAAQEGVTGRGIMWLENCSDNLVTGRPQAEADDIKNFKMTSENSRDVKITWAQMYQLIAKANAVLQNVDKVVKIDANYKNNAIGQSHFYRAFAYLWLAPYYGDNGSSGGLPIVTDQTPPEKLDAFRPTSVLENYDFIIDDMRKAGDLLPLQSELQINDYGRPHKAAAWAFAARAALYAAQYDAKYYDTVIEMCDKVMTLSGADKRDLFDNSSDNPFRDLWQIKNNFSQEYIFSLLGNANEGPKFHGMSFQNGGWGAYNTWGYFQPTLELYKAYEPGDVRRDATILYPGDTITFVGVKRTFAINPTDVSSTSGMTFRKFMAPWIPANCSGSTVNPDTDNASNKLGTCLMRFADVLLMKAEALIWKNGEGNAEAKTILNRIRKRAHLPENSTATKAELKNQRRCELAFEFMPSRHLDLVRWGDAQTEYAKPLHGIQTILKDVPDPANPGSTIKAIDKITEIEIWGSRNFNPGIHHLFPIPKKVINDSPNMVQNNGY